MSFIYILNTEALYHKVARLTEESRAFVVASINFAKVSGNVTTIGCHIGDYTPKFTQSWQLHLPLMRVQKPNVHRLYGIAKIPHLLCENKSDALAKLTLPKDANIYTSTRQICLPDSAPLQFKSLRMNFRI